jgi:hypothetical protein
MRNVSQPKIRLLEEVESPGGVRCEAPQAAKSKARWHGHTGEAVSLPITRHRGVDGQAKCIEASLSATRYKFPCKSADPKDKEQKDKTQLKLKQIEANKEINRKLTAQQKQQNIHNKKK